MRVMLSNRLESLKAEHPGASRFSTEPASLVRREPFEGLS